MNDDSLKTFLIVLKERLGVLMDWIPESKEVSIRVERMATRTRTENYRVPDIGYTIISVWILVTQ